MACKPMDASPLGQAALRDQPRALAAGLQAAVHAATRTAQQAAGQAEAVAGSAAAARAEWAAALAEARPRRRSPGPAALPPPPFGRRPRGVRWGPVMEGFLCPPQGVWRRWGMSGRRMRCRSVPW